MDITASVDPQSSADESATEYKVPPPDKICLRCIQMVWEGTHLGVGFNCNFDEAKHHHGKCLTCHIAGVRCEDIPEGVSFAANALVNACARWCDGTPISSKDSNGALADRQDRFNELLEGCTEDRARAFPYRATRREDTELRSCMVRELRTGNRLRMEDLDVNKRLLDCFEDIKALKEKKLGLLKNVLDVQKNTEATNAELVVGTHLLANTVEGLVHRLESLLQLVPAAISNMINPPPSNPMELSVTDYPDNPAHGAKVSKRRYVQDLDSESESLDGAGGKLQAVHKSNDEEKSKKQKDKKSRKHRNPRSESYEDEGAIKETLSFFDDDEEKYKKKKAKKNHKHDDTEAKFQQPADAIDIHQSHKKNKTTAVAISSGIAVKDFQTQHEKKIKGNGNGNGNSYTALVKAQYAEPAELTSLPSRSKKKQRQLEKAQKKKNKNKNKSNFEHKTSLGKHGL